MSPKFYRFWILFQDQTGKQIKSEMLINADKIDCIFSAPDGNTIIKIGEAHYISFLDYETLVSKLDLTPLLN